MPTSKDKPKSTPKPTKSGKKDDCEKDGVQQTLDSMITHIDSDIADLVRVLNCFNQKFDALASKSDIEAAIKNLASESFVEDRINTLKQDLKEEISKEFRSELEKLHQKFTDVESKLLDQEKEIVELKNNTSDLKVK